jgi:crotonobetainyl-CoA:carnitine CoA-transferase CaiB-like acyl-CoA transferase
LSRAAKVHRAAVRSDEPSVQSARARRGGGPALGDYSRLLPFLFNGINRNKKSLALDLKSPEGKKIFLELAGKADVVLEGFRPGVTRKLGIDYAALKEINPKIIYCSITGYGQDGPYSGISGHDINYLGVSGLLSISADPEQCNRIPELPVGDLAGSMFAALSILSALIHRDRTGQGQYIDVSMTAGIFSWLGASLGAGLHKDGARDRVYLPHYGVFKTSDDKFITLGIVHEEHFWRNLCAVLDLGGLSDLTLLDRIVRREEILGMLRTAFLARTRDQWIEVLNQADVPCGPVLTIRESFDDPQITHRDLAFDMELPGQGILRQRGFPASFSATMPRRDSPPPSHGQHSEEIAAALGYTDREILDLKKKRVIAP